MMMMMIPPVQAGISGPSIDITSHDRCGSDVLIHIRVAVTHDRWDGVYGVK
jgi:hypothetical protein